MKKYYFVLNNGISRIEQEYNGAIYVRGHVRINLVGKNISLADVFNYVTICQENGSVFKGYISEECGQIIYGRITIYKITPRGIYINNSAAEVDNKNIARIYEKLKLEYFTLLLCLKALGRKMPQALKYYLHG